MLKPQPYIRIQREHSHLKGRKQHLTRNGVGWHLDLGLPASRTVKDQFLLFKPPILGYFVMAA